jgi:hypothetical protein
MREALKFSPREVEDVGFVRVYFCFRLLPLPVCSFVRMTSLPVSGDLERTVFLRKIFGVTST